MTEARYSCPLCNYKVRVSVSDAYGLAVECVSCGLEMDKKYARTQ